MSNWCVWHRGAFGVWSVTTHTHIPVSSLVPSMVHRTSVGSQNETKPLLYNTHIFIRTRSSSVGLLIQEVFSYFQYQYSVHYALTILAQHHCIRIHTITATNCNIKNKYIQVHTCMKLLFISSTPYHHLHGRRERERGEKEGREYMREDEWMLVQNLLIPY